MSSTSLAQRAYDHLLDQLLSRRLTVGDWVDRRAIASELQTSVAPVGEAIVQLEAEGFLESLPRRGTRVRAQKREELRGQLLVREALECQAARLYCGHVVAAQCGRLQLLADVADARQVDLIAAKRADLELHRALVQLAGCPVLSSYFARVMKMGLFMAVDEFMATRAEETPSDNHHRLIAELCSAGPDEADALLRRHIRQGKGDLFTRTAVPSTKQCHSSLTPGDPNRCNEGFEPAASAASL